MELTTYTVKNGTRILYNNILASSYAEAARTALVRQSGRGKIQAFQTSGPFNGPGNYVAREYVRGVFQTVRGVPSVTVSLATDENLG